MRRKKDLHGTLIGAIKTGKGNGRSARVFVTRDKAAELAVIYIFNRVLMGIWDALDVVKWKVMREWDEVESIQAESPECGERCGCESQEVDSQQELFGEKEGSLPAEKEEEAPQEASPETDDEVIPW